MVLAISLGSWVAIGLASLALILAFFPVILAWKGSALFFPNRQKMIESYGGLPAELAKGSKLWIAWEVGVYINSFDPALLKNVSRIVSVDPRTEYFKNLPKVADRPDEDYSSNVREVVRLCEEHGIELRWSRTQLMNCVIAPEADDAWARINFFLPYTRPVNWPILVIHRKRDPGAFESIKSAYDEMFKRANKPDIQDWESPSSS